ncbi:MAG: hypothetical protein ACTSXH_09480 [Promethearchaeota archaeon]
MKFAVLLQVGQNTYLAPLFFKICPHEVQYIIIVQVIQKDRIQKDYPNVIKVS